MSYANLLMSLRQGAMALPEIACAKSFRIGAAHQFISFLHEKWDHHPKSMVKNWKAHISVHPDDLERAWDIMLPILCENADAFKVVDDLLMKTEFQALSHRGTLLKLKYQSISKITQSEKLSFYQMKKLVKHYLSLIGEPPAEVGLFEKLRFYVSHVLKTTYSCLKKQLSPIDYIKHTYQKLYEKVLYALEQTERFLHGMQVTVFMCPGSEQEHWNMLNKVEQALIVAGIRPGEIYETDRALGKYVSVRHPGEKYTRGVDAQSYNPDSKKDPFPLLSTYHTMASRDTEHDIPIEAIKLPVALKVVSQCVLTGAANSMQPVL